MQIKFIKRNFIEISVAGAFLALFESGFGRAIMMSSCRRTFMVKRSVAPGLEEKLSINSSQVNGCDCD